MQHRILVTFFIAVFGGTAQAFRVNRLTKVDGKVFSKVQLFQQRSSWDEASDGEGSRPSAHIEFEHISKDYPLEHAASKNSSSKELRVAFVGNSFTYYNDLPHLVKSFLAQGIVVKVGACLRGGANLDSIWHQGADYGGAFTGIGRQDMYSTVQGMLLEDGGWDVVILQDHSQYPAREEKRESSKRALSGNYIPLLRSIKGQSPLVVLYQTWGYRAFTKRSEEIGDFDTFTARLAEGYNDYHDLLDQSGLDVSIAPVGLAFQKLNLQALAMCPWLSGSTARTDQIECMDGTLCADWSCCNSHGGRAKCPPNLPHMCNAKTCAGNTAHCCKTSCDNYGGLRQCHDDAAQLWRLLYYDDNFHPSALGSFLNAAVIATTIANSSRFAWLFSQGLKIASKWPSAGVAPPVGGKPLPRQEHLAQVLDAAGIPTMPEAPTPVPTPVPTRDPRLYPTNVPVLIRSHRQQNLQDKGGQVQLTDNMQSWETWTIVDAGNGKVRIQSHRGQHLQDNNGQISLSRNTESWEQWMISDAGNGKVSITSHRNQHLQDAHGRVGLSKNMQSWEQWFIITK